MGDDHAAGRILELLRSPVDDDALAEALRHIAPAGARVEPTTESAKDRAAGIRGAIVDVDDGTYELRWCPDRGVPWAVTAGDDWAEQLVCSCGATSLSLAEVMLALRAAGERFAGILQQIRRQCVLNRLVDESAVDPSPEDVDATLAELADARGSAPDAFLADLRAHGFTQQQIRGHLHTQAAVRTMRRAALAGAQVDGRGSVVEAWWLRCPGKPAGRWATGLSSTDPEVGLSVAQAFVREHGDGVELAIATRPRPLLPAFLRDTQVGATAVDRATPGAFRCGGVLRARPDAEVDARSARLIMQETFRQWVDGRPENAELRWHWDV